MNNYLKIHILFFFFILPSWAYSAKIEVFVSILPQQYLVERIGGEQVNVSVMVKPGQSPATFEPSPKVMSVYSKSDVYFTIGMPFEQVWINRVASLNSNVSIVQTQPDENDTGSQKDHVLLPGHHHSFDPHTWLSPVFLLEQAKIIAVELTRLSPENKDYYYNNYNKLSFEVNVLNEELLVLFKENNKTNFVTFHPAFSYFARQYGLTQVAIEVEGKEPSAKQIAQVINRIKNKNVKYILIEKQFNKVIPQTIAHSVGAQLLIIDPLALDYLPNMRDIAEKINRALF
ncbi:MAG: zinc ABC transporter substrate-binding protein [gamma proteobacterium symbiont of Bathyaustriella thionipta]|nr:zinc ABC transporter substrate-binding protein [gamma proteobacterium symbiont of Bathyaustriella thionipta]MCU7950145.1 zinc ABC transporter substrate-binding protein [gamma proteobacterium symbiont of Bathyaustriella thionipta]MCU7952271.1 zinc ABC transporter substrate-binding protein [gamma proteobacterium symbiont of Bathyaustriella thionipta]MCU7956943.1 zinc ABC transporter substrate-binding protein [gamma proteobacterium symbiont of Bathyaustriella thionipta]MCU7965804.1 zinc ABC tra